MIRLRLGDFIRSNGSKFALARLFGAGLGKEKFSYGEADPVEAATEAEDNKMLFELDLEGVRDTKNEKDYLSKGKQVILKRSTSHGYTTYKDEGGGGFLSFMMGPPKLPFQTWTRSDAVVTVEEAQDRPDTIDKETMGKLKDEQSFTKKPFQYKVKFVNGKDDPANPNSEECYMLVLASDLKPIEGDKVKEQKDQIDFDLEKASGEFFASKNNSIMQAYDSTRGRGLAGFITSMNFDYSQSTYEVGSLSRRAPIFLKVTMGFAPIHDIPPGMDADGANRAPLYPVGAISSHLAGDELADTKHFGIANKKDGMKDRFDKEHTKLSQVDKDNKRYK